MQFDFHWKEVSASLRTEMGFRLLFYAAPQKLGGMKQKPEIRLGSQASICLLYEYFAKHWKSTQSQDIWYLVMYSVQAHQEQIHLLVGDSCHRHPCTQWLVMHGIISGLSMLFVLILDPKGFSWFSSFPIFSKNHHFQIPIWLGIDSPKSF